MRSKWFPGLSVAPPGVGGCAPPPSPAHWDDSPYTHRAEVLHSGAAGRHGCVSFDGARNERGGYAAEVERWCWSGSESAEEAALGSGGEGGAFQAACCAGEELRDVEVAAADP